MSSGGRDRLGRDDRREMLLDVAAELVVDDASEAVSMEQVAERAGVSRPLVYKHFANRDELLGALYRREARRLHAALVGEVEAADSIEAMFRALVHGALVAAAERGQVFAALRTGGWSRQVRREQRARDARTAQAFTERAARELGIDPHRGPPAVSLLLSLIDPVLTQWRLVPTPERAAVLEESYMAIVGATLRDLATLRNER
ncbi:MAG: TetR/AcrR family transcriptional regulator [Acidimicrobiia bacterium]|nr:TetR/AcrR family transcriptional regulator [Acidimicrobiia bacterium]